MLGLAVGALLPPPVSQALTDLCTSAAHNLTSSLWAVGQSMGESIDHRALALSCLILGVISPSFLALMLASAGLLVERHSKVLVVILCLMCVIAEVSLLPATQALIAVPLTAVSAIAVAFAGRLARYVSTVLAATLAAHIGIESMISISKGNTPPIVMHAVQGLGPASHYLPQTGGKIAIWLVILLSLGVLPVIVATLRLSAQD